MDHVEYLFLLGRAHRIFNLEEEALAGGGKFHASQPFHNIDGVEVQLRISRIFPSDEKPKLVLRVRHKATKDCAEVVANIATKMLGPDLVRVPVPIHFQDELEHVFMSDTIPIDPLSTLKKP